MAKFQNVALVGFFVIFSFAASSQSPQVCTKHLRINEAISKKWSPGVVQDNQQRTGGTIYEISVEIKRGDAITFENLIVENQVLPVEVVKDQRRNAAGPFRKGDVVKLIARTDEKKTPGSSDQSVIVKLKNEKATAAILYRQKEKYYIHPLNGLENKRTHPLSQ